MSNVTCFIASLAGGGAEHQMAILSSLLTEKGYDVTIVTYCGISDFYDIDPRVKRVELNAQGNIIAKWFTIFKYFISHKTDCIISFMMKMNFILLLAVLFKKCKVIVGERNVTIGKPNFYGWMNIHLLYYRAKYIVANTFTQKEYLVNENINLKNRISTIINYTDLNLFTPSVIPSDTSCIRIGVFARFYQQKNYERFAMMLKQLKQKTDREFSICWYGYFYKSDNELLNGYLHFKKLIEELEIDDVISLHPQVKIVNSEIEKYHAICLPSIYEGFSNSIAEGICAGRPMLVSNVSDNYLMVHNEENGYLFDPYDVKSMVDAFLKFFSLNYSEISEMGLKSREIAEQLFDKEQFVSSYINLIEH